MKKWSRVLAGLLAVLLLAGCGGNGQSPVSTKPTDAEQSTNSGTANSRELLYGFDYDDVTLTDGMFKDTFDNCMAFYDQLTADDILYRWRKKAGIDTATGRDLQWEAESASECCLAQLISAKARRYAVTGAEEDKQIVQDILDGYQEIIDKTGDHPLMYSAYFYEKTLRAFIDAYECCGLEQGYEMAKDFLSYGMNNDPFKEPTKLMGDNGSEWYTMSEVLYHFAFLAKSKGESAALVKSYLEFAKLYEYTDFWNIFYNEENVFDYSVEVDRPFNEWFHAYSHFNSFNSALEAYKHTGNAYYLDATKKFYDWALQEQKQATGGYGAQWEWILPRDVMIGFLETTDRSTETQCNSYAIVNLDNRLMAHTADASYGQWTEDALYNMTIASLETRDGYPTYYSDYSSDGGTKYLRWDWPWACCAGTRPLVVMEYLKSIYFHDTQNLYVNLYTNSSVSLNTESGNTITLSQQSDFPEDTKVVFTVDVKENAEFTISFRQPTWVAGEVVISVNGEQVSYVQENGWLKVTRSWQSGDVVTVDMPMNLYYEAITMDGEGVYALKYGPVVLACEGVVENLKSIVPIDADPNTILQKQEGSLTFTAQGATFKPYYAYDEGERYILYMSTR